MTALRPAAAAGVVTALVALHACRTPPEKTPEGTLGLLQRSLATGSPAIDRVADTRVYNESAALTQGRNIQIHSGTPVTARGLAQILEDVTLQADPRTYFAGVPTLLRQGHCERIGDATLPEFLRHIPEPIDGWPPVAMDLARSVARRLTNAVVADFRCDGGPSFRAAFSRPHPDDGTYRVAWIGPAGRP